MSDTEHHLLVEKNLKEVFNERDSNRRLQAIRTLYAEGAVFYEGQEKFQGWVEISKRFDAILASIPTEFTFSLTKPAGRIEDLEQLA